MLRLPRRAKNRSHTYRRRMLGKSAIGGGGLFALAAIAFLASASPFTVIPGIIIVVLLVVVGAFFMSSFAGPFLL